MSFEKPNVSPELENLTPHTDVKDVAKALGFGNITTDNALMIQGQAFTAESLDTAWEEITVKDDQMKVLNSISMSQAGNIIDQWDEVYSIGHRRGISISNVDGMSKQATRSGRRRFLRLKFFTSQWGVNENVTAQANFMQEFNKEDVAAITRMRQDYSWMIYEGSSAFTSNTSEPKAGNEFDGLKSIALDPEYYGYYDGPMVYDAFIQGSGLDARGLSNPKDIETGLLELSQRMIQPQNGVSQSPHIWMGTSVRALVNKYQNFEPLQILGSSQQDIVKGAIIQGFANPFTDAQVTRVNTDPFLPDIRSANNWMVPASVKGEAVQTVQPTVAATPAASDPESYFNAGWDGTYYYGVVPFGMNISRVGYEGDTTVTAAVAVAQGGKVTLTITRGAGGLEDGYLIYRSEKNGDNKPENMRLIKRIPATGNTTTFVDLNRELPGASTVYVVDFSDPGAVAFRYLYNPIRTPLPRNPDQGRILPAFVAHALCLRSKKHRSIGIIRNVMAEEGWRPQGRS
ncbi:hypothetical protein [Deinococcus sp. S9]|uniref:hypothetical protein n=1 Tax=Deinococcus sp. S9 TaxID=2545754 RepID=UPI001056A729|nr:hypothetical protein [Deinococcus sp. S9]TDE85585.1 hypothetical protein E0686_11275 [Deinococcus sp. S9]